jgi:hypothetical protein
VLQITNESAREIYFKNDEYYYCDTHKKVEEEIRTGYFTTALRPNSPCKTKRGNLKIL